MGCVGYQWGAHALPLSHLLCLSLTSSVKGPEAQQHRSEWELRDQTPRLWPGTSVGRDHDRIRHDALLESARDHAELDALRSERLVSGVWEVGLVYVFLRLLGCHCGSWDWAQASWQWLAREWRKVYCNSQFQGIFPQCCVVHTVTCTCILHVKVCHSYRINLVCG